MAKNCIKSGKNLKLGKWFSLFQKNIREFINSIDGSRLKLEIKYNTKFSTKTLITGKNSEECNRGQNLFF